MFFWQLELSENATALILTQMKVLDITHDRSKDVDLGPVKTHINQDKLEYARVDQLVDVFVCEVVWGQLYEFVPCQCDEAQVAKLLDNFEVLIPRVKKVLVEIEIESSWNQLFKNACFTQR